MRSVTVIGAGPAGATAAVQCKRLGLDPIIIEKTGVVGGLVAQGFRIENYPGLEHPISGGVFADRLKQHLDRFGLKVTTGSVEQVHTKPEGGFEVRWNGGALESRCVIIATGSAPKTSGTPGENDCVENNRAFYAVTDLLSHIEAPRHVVVIGGGEASFDYALSTAAAGASTTILVRNARERATGALAAAAAQNPLVHIQRNTAVEGLCVTGETVKVNTGTRTFTADGVLIAVGRATTAPGLLAKEIPLPAPIPLTPAPGLFICGDARSGSLGQVGQAVGDGLTAAAAAARIVMEKTR